MLQDPPSLLTASRDRSVKLRALPTLDDQTAASTIKTHKAEPMTPQDPKTTQSVNDKDNHGDDADPTTLTSRQPPPQPPPANPEGQEPVGGEDDASKKTLKGDESGGTSAVPGGCSVSPTGTDGSPACSLSSSKTTTSTKPPPHGYDLATLTLGRIADACRRDAYFFPVDLKGRGEGRAVEARAVLQVTNKITPLGLSS